MKQYKIVSAIWEDHSTFHSAELPDDLSGLITPSITVGIVQQETDRYLVLISHIERYGYGDRADYTVILRDSILGMKEYGTIELENLGSKEGSK